jgi:hypothetical protein
MVDFFERETEMKFIPTLYPDYHPDVPGGAAIGRSILAQAYDIRGLGKDMPRLKPPLKTITFIGMMFNSSNADLKHFFQFTKSLTSFLYVAKRLVNHIKELALYQRAINVTSGNALAARLAKSTLDLGIPILTSTPAKRVLTENGQVVGMLVGGEGGDREIRARRGVVLACGGFPQDVQRIAKAYPHLQSGGEHLSPTPETNTGDGVRMAETAGADVDLRLKDAAAWMPVSKVPFGNGEFGVFPHLLDRYKPGVIGVLRNGKRFTNESNSYHDVGVAMIEACKGQKETVMWLVCDKTTLGKYGLGSSNLRPCLLANTSAMVTSLRARHWPIWRRSPALMRPAWKPPCTNTTPVPSTVWTNNTPAAPPPSTAIWPTPTTNPTPVWHRLKEVRSMRSNC